MSLCYTVTPKTPFFNFGVTKKPLYIEPMLHHYTKIPVKFEKNSIYGVTKVIL